MCGGRQARVNLLLPLMMNTGLMYGLVYPHGRKGQGGQVADLRIPHLLIPGDIF